MRRTREVREVRELDFDFLPTPSFPSLLFPFLFLVWGPKWLAWVAPQLFLISSLPMDYYSYVISWLHLLIMLTILC